MIWVALLLTVVCSALFAGLETGVVTLNRVRLRVLAGRGDARAKELLSLLDRPERVLTAFLVGNTLCNVAGGALATTWAASQLGETAGSVAATVVMTSVFLVFSEILPKIYFRRRAMETVPRMLWFVRLSKFLFHPVVLLASSVFGRMKGASGRSPFVTRDELRQLVREAAGRLGAGEKRMLEAVFDFGHTTAKEVMIPLPEVVSLPEETPPAELLETVRVQRFTRIPVYRERPDHLTGVVNVFEVLYDEARKVSLKEYAQPLQVVPDGQKIARILLDLQHRRESMALVVNEFGACVGIVTLTDIIEEIMGELVDEHEEFSTPIQRVGDAYMLEAGLDIDDLNEALGLGLEKRGFETVAGLVLEKLGRIPRVGEHIVINNLDFEVLATHQYGLRRLKMRVKETPEEGSGDAG